MKAYFVTTHHSLTDPTKRDKRTVGFFKTLKEAKAVVEENQGDIFEYYYNHATIECLRDGLYPCDGYSEETIFYEWDVNKRKYIEIPKPECLKGFYGFSNVG